MRVTVFRLEVFRLRVFRLGVFRLGDRFDVFRLGSPLTKRMLISVFGAIDGY